MQPTTEGQGAGGVEAPAAPPRQHVAAPVVRPLRPVEAVVDAEFEDDGPTPERAPKGGARKKRHKPTGRPPAGTERTKRTIKDDWRKARTDEARAAVIALARRADMLVQLPTEALQWGLAQHLLTERQVAQALGLSLPNVQPPEPQGAPAAVPEAPPAQPQAQPHQAEAAQVGPAPVVAPGAAAPAAEPRAAGPAGPVATGAVPPATPPVPEVHKYMGQDERRVAMFADAIAPVVEGIAKRLSVDGLDPMERSRLTLFPGHPRMEKKIDCVPVARMAELGGVLLADRYPGGDGGEAGVGDAKAELALLALATLAPGLVRVGKRAVGMLWGMGRGLGAKLRERRGAREVGEP